MNVKCFMKENLDISGKKLQIVSERHLGVALDDFVLKDMRQVTADKYLYLSSDL